MKISKERRDKLIGAGIASIVVGIFVILVDSIAKIFNRKK